MPPEEFIQHVIKEFSDYLRRQEKIQIGRANDFKHTAARGHTPSKRFSELIALRLFVRAFWTKSCYYSDENFFTALVHTTLDNLGTLH